MVNSYRKHFESVFGFVRDDLTQFRHILQSFEIHWKRKFRHAERVSNVFIITNPREENSPRDFLSLRLDTQYHLIYKILCYWITRNEMQPIPDVFSMLVWIETVIILFDCRVFLSETSADNRMYQIQSELPISKYFRSIWCPSKRAWILSKFPRHPAWNQNFENESAFGAEWS